LTGHRLVPELVGKPAPTFLAHRAAQRRIVGQPQDGGLEARQVTRLEQNAGFG
jgi:hypothetical protein